MLYGLFSLFFLSACLISTATYVSVVDAQDRIQLTAPTEGASLLPNGTLLISYYVEVENPSKYEIDVFSMNWEVTVVNGTAGPGWLIPVTGRYLSSSNSPTLPARQTTAISFSAYVTESSTISALRGYVNYSNAQGADVTLETVHFTHRFTLTGWLGSFEHEYLREFYLNDLVKVSLDYRTEEQS